ncbi:MAG: RelA/SpoT family protein [Bacteroidales bacterium]|nr:RelA/SpoT family protein [Bacteroidales bacterium]
MISGVFDNNDLEIIRKDYEAFRVLAKQRCANDEEFQTVERAFEFARSAHNNVRRRSGEPYIIHPIAVASIVVSEIGLGYKSICAALLHDVVEDTDFTVGDISEAFGEKIASLVDGLTKIKTVLDNEDRNEHTTTLQAENFRRILLTLNDDVRVVLIKLADRLHNCRTIEFMPEHKRDKILAETMYIFIPLAHRLGLYGVKSEMENIWLKFSEPEEYRRITEKVNASVEVRSAQVDQLIENISEVLEKHDFKFKVLKRVKTPYSIWRKMNNKHVPFDQIYDLYAVRIIYETNDKDPDKEREQAFLIYSYILCLYTSKESRFRNWISQPKSNGYEALHCTLMGPGGAWVEVQIRSRRMDDIAERGIAAHWSYKQEGYISEEDTEMDHWLSRVQQVLNSSNVNDLGLLDIIHTDLISKDIFVFTPKGEQKRVPLGSTALDFAYLIHSKIGDTATAAKVNMRLVPLSQTLKTGDQVEIITDPGSLPKKEWLKFLKTRHSRAHVIDYFRTRRDEIIKEGEKLYFDYLNVRGIKDSRQLQRQFQDYVQINDQNEVYFKVGLGIIGPDVFNMILEDSLPSRQVAKDGKKYVLATCCHPLPGDAVMGIIDDAGVVHIHKKTCPNLEIMGTKYGNRLVPADWPDLDHDFKARLELTGVDRLGLLNEITHYISLTMGVNIRSISISTNNGIVDGNIEMLVRDKSVLTTLIYGLMKIDGIQDVTRAEV